MSLHTKVFGSIAIACAMFIALSAFISVNTDYLPTMAVRAVPFTPWLIAAWLVSYACDLLRGEG